MQLTANQQQVLVTLQQSKAPLGAYALLERVRQPGFNAPTQIYRALERLIEQGLVHRLETLNAYVPCSCQGERHGYMAFAICDTCGHIDEFVDESLSDRLRDWMKSQAFTLNSTVIEVRGQCANCRR